MDIYVKTQIDDIKGILEECRFAIKRKRNHFSAMKYIKGGRYHMLFEFIDGETFCDFHFDNTIHFIGTGADYGKKPEDFFNSELKGKFESKKIKYAIKKVNWFTRRNKAIVTGFRF